MTSRIRRPRHRDFDGLSRNRLDHTADDLSVGPAPGLDQFTFTADDVANQITIAGQDDLADGTRVIFNGDDLAAPLAEANIYYIADDGTNLYSVHATYEDAVLGQNAIDITDAGSGTQQVTILEN